MTTEHMDIETLSAFADGDLNAVQALRVERHIAGCDDCRADLERLRVLVASAGALPREVSPPPEVWAGIRSRVTSHKSRVTGRWWHNGWLAAAAALLLIAGTATLTTMLRSPDTFGSGSTVVSSNATPAVLANVERNFVPTVTQLRDAYDAQKDKLAPATVRTVDRALATIDSAIAEASAALVADPGSTQLLEILSGYYRRKIDFLTRANTVSSL